MRLVRQSLTLALGLAAVAACGTSPDSTRTAVPTDPSRIVNGTPTGNSYASVGALLYDFDQNGVLNGNDEVCTGSLVSPTVFLTAAHCVVWARRGSQFYVSFAPDLYAKGVKAITATGYEFDPAYGHDQANLHDLAVVFLPASSTRGMTPYRLPTAGELDVLAAQGALTSALFVNVGYGVSASRTGIPSFGYDGKRNVSLSEFMALQPYWLGLLMNTSATGLGGDCYGDSGGPKFLATNPGVVYATVTTGDMNCRATSWDYRTDSPSAREFLGQFLALP